MFLICKILNRTKHVRVCSTRFSTDLPFIKKSCIRVLHTPTSIVGVLEMGMKVCLRGSALEFYGSIC